MTACTNAESTKLYLALPFLGLLGYDYTNPYEVYPDHTTGTTSKADFAILRDGLPVIAMDVPRSGSDLADRRENLARYYKDVGTIRLAILTNGTLFEFYVDSAQSGVMDDSPFLTVDLETIARAGVAEEILETLLAAVNGHYDPETIAEAAHVQLVKKRLRTVFVDEAKGPSEQFCRFALERIGLSAMRKSVIDRYYAPLIKTAFEESLVIPVIERLKSQPAGEGRTGQVGLHQLGQRISTTENQLHVFNYVRRRLAYLAEEEAQYEAIDNVRYTDYVGRLTVFYDREKKGRIFDYIEGADGYDKYIFPDPIGEIVTNSLLELDTALKTVFQARVRELGGVTHHQKLARSA
ncbi:MAG: hypothetical protein ACRCS9_01090 [Hyphomicrobium sp.]